MTNRDREWHFVDKSAWGSGPWQDEPDKAMWTDEATGLACLILRNETGALCGYVGVHVGHPWYGVDRWEIRSHGAHGGVNFSRERQRLWWLGFDCSHAFDLSPALLAVPVPIPSRLFESQTYRTFAYVKKRCAMLAREAKDVDHPV